MKKTITDIRLNEGKILIKHHEWATLSFAMYQRVFKNLVILGIEINTETFDRIYYCISPLFDKLKRDEDIPIYEMGRDANTEEICFKRILEYDK